MIAATMSMRRQFPRTLPPGLSISRSEAPCWANRPPSPFERLPRLSVRPPSQKVSPLSKEPRRRQNLRIPPHQTVKVIPTAACRALLALRPYVVGVSTRRSTRWSIGRVADLKVGPLVVNHSRCLECGRRGPGCSPLGIPGGPSSCVSGIAAAGIPIRDLPEKEETRWLRPSEMR